MIILLSPAKTLDFSNSPTTTHTSPRLLADSATLVKNLRQKSVEDIKQLMKVSDKIAELNYNRFHNFTTPFTTDNAKQAVLAFKGDVYTGLQADTFHEADLEFAQRHLRILSGLYGILRPLDLMQAYRLEMGTRLQHNGTKNLYQFWDTKITDMLNTDIADSGSNAVINLASNEYFKSVKKPQLAGQLYQIDFKEERDGKYKIIAFNAKKARGAMAHEIIKHRITQAKDIKHLVAFDYQFNEGLSSDRHFVFTK